MSAGRDQVIAYHQRTKHQPNALARGPAKMDWANQPNPFRSYEGSTQIDLERKGFDEVNQQTLEPEPLDRKSLSKFFFESLALSGQKSISGSKWSLRVNPSSGNLHPTEVYLIAGSISGLEGSPGVYHYAPKSHSLELLAGIEQDSWQSFCLPDGSLLLAFSSIYWRESWKYGERAFRYCMIDLGHALGAISVAAHCLNWKSAILDDTGTDDLAGLLWQEKGSITRDISLEEEHPDVLLAIFTDGRMHNKILDLSVISHANLQSRSVRPNALSKDHIQWVEIDKVSEATKKPPTLDTYPEVISSSELLSTKFCRVLRRRRSAQVMDENAFMPLESFYAILEAIFPGNLPFGFLPWKPYIHPIIFVHRVRDIDPGLYILLRDVSVKEKLQAAMLADFVWEKPSRRAGDLGLYLLANGDGRLAAKNASCGQDIASDGCFAVAMIAEFEETLKKYGAWFYSRLYWECGVVGQALYLASEVEGFQGCGIGCFFDDTVHRMLGLSGMKYQDLYHFASGRALHDHRLMDLPAYDRP